MTTETKGTVTVYVRLGGQIAFNEDSDEKEYSRTLSFDAPEDVPQADALKKGFAIDGNSYVMEVTPCDFVNLVGLRHGGLCAAHGEGYYPLMDVLRDTEEAIMEWLGEHGYQVTFK